MIEFEKEENLKLIIKKLESQNNILIENTKKLEERDNLLIALTKEIALLRMDINKRLKN